MSTLPVSAISDETCLCKLYLEMRHVLSNSYPKWLTIIYTFVTGSYLNVQWQWMLENTKHNFKDEF